MVDGEEQQLTCEVCQQGFPYTAQERARDEEAGYPAPRVCPPCAERRREEGAARRAAKRPFRRRFRR